ncbi:cobalamin biosynthesis protein [Bacillus sp. M6-12]|uniref:CobW family GTP-binding protein n=1 Tax=Bacillus sp. M6-12 TaxID=2054166 RepID=UPI000C78F019|nr:GTP-binding protein [Bacillus sp. M6-12]PLS17071.1 cobalamin biosynthesis protein [Bacillus sp. M6-12]
MKKVEIYILGGFLGSGKTTLLRNIVKQEKAAGRKIAVLLNEMGSISIDSGLIEDDVPLKELFDGCICCTIQDKLESQLQELLLNELDAIYIETTGAAHPVEVLDGILSPLFAEGLEYKGIITVVDMLRWRDRNSLSPQLKQLLIEQIRHADYILLNKQDLVSEMEAAQIVFSIDGINPEATAVLTCHSAVSLADLQAIKMKKKTGHAKAEIGRHLNLSAIVHHFANAVSREDFELWLRDLPETVYRMKGYISFTNSQYPYLFQYSYGMPLFMRESMKMPLNLVIIGENLDPDVIIRELQDMEGRN